MEFIHIADVHLGMAPDAGFPWSEVREKEIWDTFEKVIMEIRRRKTDLLLIAGDLFHRQPLARELKEVGYLFEQIPDTRVVLIAGNHDYLKRDSNYLKYKWPSNVTGLFGASCQVCYLEDINTYVYGMSYTGREITEPVYNQNFPGGSRNLEREHEGANHILLAHGGDEKHIPIQFRQLGETDFNYIALGHIHKPQILIENKMAYSGSLEPLDKNHTGAHGFIRGTIHNGVTKIQFEPFASRNYVKLPVQVTPDTTVLSLRRQITQTLTQTGKNNIYQILLEGQREADTDFLSGHIEDLGNIVEICDRTEPEYDFMELQKQYSGTVLGEYISRFTEGNIPLDPVREKALYLGVQALLEARQ